MRSTKNTTRNHSRIALATGGVLVGANLRRPTWLKARFAARRNRHRFKQAISSRCQSCEIYPSHCIRWMRESADWKWSREAAKQAARAARCAEHDAGRRDRSIAVVLGAIGNCLRGVAIVDLSQQLGWIGVDVGTHTVKLAQVVRDGVGVRLHRAAVIQRPATWNGDDSLAQDQPITSQPEIKAALECGGIQGAKCGLCFADECLPAAKSQHSAGQRSGAADDYRRRIGRGLGGIPEPDGIRFLGNGTAPAERSHPMRSTSACWPHRDSGSARSGEIAGGRGSTVGVSTDCR